MAGRFPVKDLFLQGDVECNNFGLLNLNKSTLNLTADDVGLGNVDNTSDLNKPISNATGAALNLKQDLIPFGTTQQFYRGDKTWANYGSMALQENTSTLALFSVIGAANNTNAVLQANRNDYPTFDVNTSLQQLGAAVVGSILTGPNVPAANVGMLQFRGCSYGIIRTVGNAAPLVFGTNGITRMSLLQGLNVGGLIDPGAGCITAFGTITGGHLAGVGDGITGLLKEAIPTILNDIKPESVEIVGIAGQGYLSLVNQSSDPAGGGWAKIFSNATHKICFQQGFQAFNFALDMTGFTANRIFGLMDVAGKLGVFVDPPPAASTDAGIKGSYACDATNLYICVATGSGAGTWKRTALSSF